MTNEIVNGILRVLIFFASLNVAFWAGRIVEAKKLLKN